MTSLSFLPNNDILKKEGKIKIVITPENDKINFNDFNSTLFLSEYQGNEENSSEISNKEKEKNSSNKSFKYSISSINCITKELIEILENDLNTANKEEKLSQLIKKENNNGNDKTHLPIITKNFMFQTDIFTQKKNNENIKDKNIIYEENINDCEFQLKFIENSLHNILPKTYQKSQLNNNSYNKGQNASPFYYPTKFDITQNNYNSSFCKNEIKVNNNFSFASPFNSNINKNNNHSFIFHSSKINNNGNYYNNRINYQTHSLKLSNSKCFKWKCKFCNNINKGYCKTCFNCRKNKQAKI